MALIGQIIFLLDEVTRGIIAHRRRRRSMIVEVRSYRIKPGRREEFVQFFETRSAPALRSHGMRVVGPLLDLENPNKFVWLRIFPSLDERERMKAAFYEGELWKNELESIAMPMIESYDVIHCETSAGCMFDGALEES
jgi:heme-degrading monooxygenase HmoA